MSTSIAVIDSTVQLSWEITKEKFDQCEFGQSITSPNYKVKIDRQESKWEIQMYPRGDEESVRNKVTTYLYNRGHVRYTVSNVFKLKTANEYWPTDAVKDLYSIQRKRKENIFKPEGAWGYSIGSTKNISGRFSNNKITIVATLVIYMKGEGYLEHKKAAADFVHNARSVKDFTTLCNVTLVCQGEKFKCHKAVLASVSSFFKTKFTNGNFSDKNDKVVKIDDSTSEIVEKMVKFMSNGLIPDDIDEVAGDLIKLSTFYGIDALTNVCEKALIRNLSSENVIETFISFDQYLPMSENRQSILEFIKTNKNEVVASQDWDMFCTNHPKLVAETVKKL